MVYIFWQKNKTSNTNKGTEISSENTELAKELHKPIIKKIEKRKQHSSNRDKICN